MMNDTRGVWYFENLSHSSTILAIEPDGTQHTVKFGDMNSAAGIALLNAMTRDLIKPYQIDATTGETQWIREL